MCFWGRFNRSQEGPNPQRVQDLVVVVCLFGSGREEQKLGVDDGQGPTLSLQSNLEWDFDTSDFWRE